MFDGAADGTQETINEIVWALAILPTFIHWLIQGPFESIVISRAIPTGRATGSGVIYPISSTVARLAYASDSLWAEMLTNVPRFRSCPIINAVLWWPSGSLMTASYARTTMGLTRRAISGGRRTAAFGGNPATRPMRASCQKRTIEKKPPSPRICTQRSAPIQNPMGLRFLRDVQILSFWLNIANHNKLF